LPSSHVTLRTADIRDPQRPEHRRQVYDNERHYHGHDQADRKEGASEEDGHGQRGGQPQRGHQGPQGLQLAHGSADEGKDWFRARQEPLRSSAGDGQPERPQDRVEVHDDERDDDRHRQVDGERGPADDEPVHQRRGDDDERDERGEIAERRVILAQERGQLRWEHGLRFRGG